MLRFWINGQPTLKFGQRIAKFIGTAQIGWDHTGSAKSGTITDARFTQYPNVVPIAMMVDGNIAPRAGMPSFSFSGNTLTWMYPQDYASPAYRGNCTIAYGIF